jgi:hypothetical protein
VGARKRIAVPGLEARLIVGAANPHSAAVARASKGSDHKLHVIRNTRRMPQLMSWADVAICAGGSTCWEIAILGLPSLVMAVAENQRGVVRAVAEGGAAVALSPRDSPAAIARALESLCRDPKRRHALSETGRRLVDGGGAARVAAILEALQAPRLSAEAGIRHAELGDARAVWAISNDPSVRANSFSRKSIPWENHLCWFRKRLSGAAESFWVLTVAPNEPSTRAFARAGFTRLKDVRIRRRLCAVFERNGGASS